MSNYYEILNVPHTVSHSEIEQVLDAQYNKVRGLISDHDPNVLNQANSGLQMFEKIRSTLMDAGKRSAYDEAIFHHMGDLINPAICSPSGNSQPILLGDNYHPIISPSSSQPVVPISGQRSWLCPKCQHTSAVNSQYCKLCGETSATPCPSCGKLAEKCAEFCTSCGVNIPNARQKAVSQIDLFKIMETPNHA